MPVVFENGEGGLSIRNKINEGFTKLNGIEAAADVTDTANVTAAGALMDSEVTNLAAVKAFAPADYATAAQGGLADTAVQPGDDAATLGAGAALDGYVLTANGAGVAAWEAAAGGGGSTAVNAQTGTTYTLVLGDGNDIVTMSNAAANTLTVPANASVAFPIGTIVSVIQLGAGATTITFGTGVTGNGVPAGSATLTAQHSAVSLAKIAADVWNLAGDHGGVS